MAKSKKEEAAPMVISPELQVSLDQINQFKAEVDKVGENCLKIKVVDEGTMSIATNNLSKVNDLVNLIEAKRVEIKAPYLSSGTLIDQTAKSIAEKAIAAVAHLKEELKQWEFKRIELENKKREELQKEHEKKLAEIEAQDKKRKEIQAYISDELTPWLKKQYAGIKTAEEADKVLNTLKAKWPPAERFGEFLEQGNDLRDSYISLIETKRGQILNAENISEEEKAIVKQREELVQQREAIAKKERELLEKEVSIAAEKAKKEAEVKLKEEQERLAKEGAEKAAKTRKIWKFELVDKTKLKPEWITVDEAAVKQYLKDNKDNTKHGDIVNGIKFYQEFNVSA
jgi:hypothetical protein